jgi:hypothetical protein
MLLVFQSTFRKLSAGGMQSWDLDQGIKQISSQKAHDGQINDIDGCGGNQVSSS